jgi:hypothetical protein
MATLFLNFSENSNRSSFTAPKKFAPPLKRLSYHDEITRFDGYIWNTNVCEYNCVHEEFKITLWTIDN